MKQNIFKIITTAYNCRDWIAKCISSVKVQNYDNFKCIIIDDASTDETLCIAIKETKNDDRFILKRNDKNIKGLHNYVKYMSELCDNDEDIVVTLDGDDYFYHANVLNVLNNVYQDNIWMSYGQYICASDLEDRKMIKGCNAPIEDISLLRKKRINLTHLRTFKYHLWKKIKDEDLKRWDGKYVQRGWDQPFMIPNAEMSGLKRIKFIDEILYVYNNLNPQNEYKIDEPEQLKEDDYIRAKQPYKELP